MRIDTHREFLLNYILFNNLEIEDRDAYSFGVYYGRGIKYLKDMFHRKPHRFYGFDSFE